MTVTYTQENIYLCTQCGQEIPGTTMVKRQERNPDSFNTRCGDCNARPAVREGQCIPWQGEVDYDTFQPLKNGKPHLPGHRTCGHKDCVNKNHIWSTDTLNQIVKDTFYATGRLLTFDQVMSAAANRIETKKGK